MPNMTCPVDHRPEDPTPFFSGGNIQFKAHDVGWIISGFFTLIASVASFWLILKHLTYYTCPLQQRHIVRMLFMVPIYAVVSWMSYLFYRQAVYYETIRDCYEAVVITSFFYLLLQYVGDTRAEQHAVFREVKLKKWFWPMGFWKYRPTGLHFLWLMKISILQYAIVRPVCTIVAVVLEYFGIYCLDSWAPQFGHIYITLSISISVTVAMYCIIQFYLPIEKELKPYSPVLKFLAVKSVVFLTFWQDSFLSVLVFFKVIKATDYMSADEIQAGINALLETFEMVIFAFLHIKAFTYIIYRPQDHARTTSKWRAFVDVIDFRDWARQMKESSRYVYAKSRGREMTVVEDIRTDKHRHLAEALGKERAEALRLEVDAEKDANMVRVPWRYDESPTVRDDLELGRSEAAESAQKEHKSANDTDEAQSLLQQQPHTDSARLPTLDYLRGLSTTRDRHPELSQYHSAPTQDHDEGDAGLQPPTTQHQPQSRSWWRQLRQRLSGSHYEDAHEDIDDDHTHPGMSQLGGPLTVDGLEAAPLDVQIARHFALTRVDSPTGSVTDSVLNARPSPLSEFITSASGQRGARPDESNTPAPRLLSNHSTQKVPTVQMHTRPKRNTYPLVVTPSARDVEMRDDGDGKRAVGDHVQQAVDTAATARQEQGSAATTQPQRPTLAPVQSVNAAQRLTVIAGRISGPNSEQASVSGATHSAHASSSQAHEHGAQRQLRRDLADGKGSVGRAGLLPPGPISPQSSRPPTSLQPPPPRYRAPPAPAMSFSPATHTSERATPEDEVPPGPAAASVRSKSSFATARSSATSAAMAKGPKGKPIQITVPSPLSPARFPYGQEGVLPAPAPRITSGPMSTKQIREAALVQDQAGAGGGVKSRIKQEQQPSSTQPQQQRPSRAPQQQQQPSHANHGGLFRLPSGRGAESSQPRTTAAPLPAPSQMGGVSQHAELFCAVDVQQRQRQYQEQQQYQQQSSQHHHIASRAPKHPAFSPAAPPESTFAVGQIVTPAQRMNAGYQNPHAYSRQYQRPRPQPQPRHSMPVANLRGETSYDRWTGEPSASVVRPSQQQQRRTSMPAPPSAPRYDSRWQIEYID